MVRLTNQNDLIFTILQKKSEYYNKTLLGEQSVEEAYRIC